MNCVNFQYFVNQPTLARSVVDSDCHPLSYEFLCQSVQPVCYSDKMVLPCHDFCTEFLAACRDYIPSNLMETLSCRNLPTEADSHGQ